MNNEITQSDLAHFTGSESFYRHWTKRLIYSEGINYLVENGASWLVDAIASYQFEGVVTKDEDLRNFQIWELKREDVGNGATLVCRADSDKPSVIEQKIEFTDFPLPSIKLYAERGEYLTLMLPSER